MTLTQNEIRILTRIVKSDYDGGNYSFDVCADRADNATFGSLVKKGLAASDDLRFNFTMSETWMWLTDKGAEVAKGMGLQGMGLPYEF